MEGDQKNQQILDFSKQLKFKQYSSLELNTRNKFIKRIQQLQFDSPQILWVASEKIHGSNFSVHYNGETARYGRRTDFLSKQVPVPCQNPGEYITESFYDVRSLIKKFHNCLKDIFLNIKKYDENLLKFSIYGEYFGGYFPANQVNAVKNDAKIVQRGVYYTPNHEFFAFDIFITSKEYIYWADVEDIPKYLNNLIPSVPIYTKGTFDQVFNTNSQFNSTIPDLLGFGKLQKNICEGLVIRPNKNLQIPGRERVIIKKKNKQFLEKASEPNPDKKIKKQKVLEADIAISLEELAKYLNENRIDSVVSKFPDLKDRNKLKQLVSKDILSDAEKDEFKLPEVPEKAKKVVQELENLIIKEINNYFVKQ